MTESTSAVEQAVQARIAAARQRTENEQRRRRELTEARQRGLTRRHARKLRNLADRTDAPPTAA
ncbi:hypothetical protein [Streptomyces hydrogenans]|uniref:hypothetical protein n=1 Tax=Streptomyces hydrogenans TaxID=1873719 RepID=UPI0037FA568E